MKYVLTLIGALSIAASVSAEETLKEKLEARSAEAAKNSPTERREKYQEGIDTVAASGIYDRAKKVGDKAPDFTLKNHLGEEVALSELLKEGPVILTWYRGGWCPYCNIALHALQDYLGDFEELGAQLVALTPELPDYASSTVDKNEIEFQVLSDLQNGVARDYGIVFKMTDFVAKSMRQYAETHIRNDDESDELPLAATYVVDTEGVIRYAFLEADYRQRAEPSEILKALKKLKE